MGQAGSTYPPGPFRPATWAGAFVTMVEFSEIPEKRESLSPSQSWIEEKRITIGGYTMTAACKIQKDYSDQVSVTFGIALSTGDWDDRVEWPFYKTVTLTVPHLGDYYKDLKLPIILYGDDAGQKPRRGRPNPARWTEPLYWDKVSLGNFIHNQVLRVNIEIA